jgi:hypothetical protein
MRVVFLQTKIQNHDLLNAKQEHQPLVTEFIFRFYSIPAGKSLDSILNYATTASFQILSISLFTIIQSFRRYKFRVTVTVVD